MNSRWHEKLRCMGKCMATDMATGMGAWVVRGCPFSEK